MSVASEVTGNVHGEVHKPVAPVAPVTPVKKTRKPRVKKDK